jgi:hypothetical protein
MASRITGPGIAPLTTSDRAIVAMLAFFTLFNVTLDLYYVLRADDLARGAATGPAAAMWKVYAEADRFWVVAPWSRAQEALNVYVTTLLNVWLIGAIVRRRPSRHVLQLALGAYLSYSVVLYYLAAHVSGYEGMRAPSLYAFSLFYGSALPWLLGHLYMTYDSAVAISRAFAAARPVT